MIKTNQKVTTPIGEGVAQGSFQITDSSGHLIVAGVGVRLPVDDVTKKQMNKSNCLTPRANVSGLWVFSESELK